MPMPAYMIVDVFTGTPLEGNPLAVFTDARSIPADRMQRIAREMNLSETVFVLPPEQAGDARIRIFTPAGELPFAGHPTLGTAYVLCGQRGLDAIGLETGAGLIRVDFARRTASPRPAAPACPTLRPCRAACASPCPPGSSTSGHPNCSPRWAWPKRNSRSRPTATAPGTSMSPWTA